MPNDIDIRAAQLEGRTAVLRKEIDQLSSRLAEVNDRLDALQKRLDPDPTTAVKSKNYLRSPDQIRKGVRFKNRRHPDAPAYCITAVGLVRTLAIREGATPTIEATFKTDTLTDGDYYIVD